MKRLLVAAGIIVLFFACSAFTKGNKKELELYLNAYEQYAQGNFETARELLKKNGNFFPGLILQGKIAFFTAMYADAVKIFERARKLSPASIDARVWEARARLMMRSEDETKKARDVLNSVMQDEPSCIEAHSLLASIAREARDFSAEEAHLVRITEQAESIGMAYLEKARLYWVLGKKQEALDDLEKALVLLQQGSSSYEIAKTIRERIKAHESTNK